MQKLPIFIVGMPACGKSTFGRALAAKLSRQYIDLDAYIENRFHTSIQQIFAHRGEADFRDLEEAMLREVGEFENVVIATGGGAPCHADNMQYMNSRGTTIWIQASLPRIMQRILRKPSKRPLLANLSEQALHQRLTEMLALRSPHYNAAHIHFATDRLENRQQISDSLAVFLANYPLT